MAEQEVTPVSIDVDTESLAMVCTSPDGAPELQLTPAMVTETSTSDASALERASKWLPMEVETQEAVSRLENAMVEKFPEIQIELKHLFSDGLYLREVFIPAGTLLTGKIHREQHLVVVSQGYMSVWTEGKGSEMVVAPSTFVSQPGTRRVGYAYEDTVWTTVHPNPQNETDIEKLEERLLLTRDQMGWTGRLMVPGVAEDMVPPELKEKVGA